MDEQTKVVNRSLSTMVKATLKDNHWSRDKYLSHIEFTYNKVVFQDISFWDYLWFQPSLDF